MTPTTVPPVAFSATELAAASVYVTALTVNSEVSSVTPMTKVWALVDPSVEVAVTSMVVVPSLFRTTSMVW